MGTAGAGSPMQTSRAVQKYGGTTGNLCHRVGTFPEASRLVAMAKIYIDANIYLSFYVADRRKLRELLPALESVAPYIFVTGQIVDEVRRNKVNVFLTHAQTFSARLPTEINLPSFDPTEDDASSKKRNRDLRAIVKKTQTIATAYNKSIASLAQSIIEDNDPVSKVLEKIFKKAEKATSGDFDKARLRREIGNPPGKRSDPLGDQLSWEQMLRRTTKGEAIWIVTRDKDYFDDHNGEPKLNPVLHHDLSGRLGTAGQFYCFRDLSKALTDFKKSSGKEVKHLPAASEMEKIAAEETRMPITISGLPNVSASSTGPNLGFYLSPQSIAPNSIFSSNTISPPLFNTSINPGIAHVGTPLSNVFNISTSPVTSDFGLYTGSSGLTFGGPHRCPKCGTTGSYSPSFSTSITIGDKTTTYLCPVCSNRW